MIKSEILNILNPNNTRLEFLTHDKYEITLLDDSEIVGCFDFASVTDLSDNNTWKILLATNLKNLKYEGHSSVTLKGQEIKNIYRLN